MQYRILGPLVVAKDGAEIVVGSGKQRMLLALLLLHANEPVSTDRLIDQLWGESRSTSATKVLQNYISKLRRLLGEGVLITRGRAYELRVESGELDLDRFNDQVADGRRRWLPATLRTPRRSRSGSRPLARAAAGRLRLRPVRPDGDRAARRAAARGSGRADRRGSPARASRRPDRRARSPRRRVSTSGTAAWPADARALPLRAPGRGAPRLPGHAAGTRRRARDRAESGAAAAREADPESRSRACRRGRRFGATEPRDGERRACRLSRRPWSVASARSRR